MSGMRLYLRSRSVPAAAALAALLVAAVWTGWAVFGGTRDIDPPLGILTVVLLGCVTGATLSGPDDALDRTAARPWPPRRLLHLAVAGAAVLTALGVTLPTPARFVPFAVLARDCAGLLGATALGAAALGAGRSWLAPLVWTMFALVHPPLGDTVAAQALTWMAQPLTNGPAAAVSALLAVGGGAAYSMRGCPLRPASDPAPS